MEVWMMIKTLHRPFLDPLHHQNTRSSLLWSWGSVWTYRAQHCQWRQREREKLSEIPELSGIWKPPSDRSLAKLEPRVMEMFTFLSTLGAAWHSPSNYVSNKEIERRRVCCVLCSSVQFSRKTVQCREKLLIGRMTGGWYESLLMVKGDRRSIIITIYTWCLSTCLEICHN